MKSREKIISVLLTISFVVNVALIVDRPVTVKEYHHHTVVTERDTLTEWELFTLALMKTESAYDSTAVSSAGARGLFQMTPIYVREVNRIHNTHFKFEHVIHFDSAYAIFDLMQKGHNPEYDMERALDIHNGTHLWYHRKVYQEMERIRRYEELRNRVKGK